MNIWQGEKVRLRAVEEKDLEGYFCRKGPVDSVSERNGDRAIFPKSSVMMRDRVNHLAKSNPYEEEFFMIIEDNDGHAVGNINTHSVNRVNGTFEYGIGIVDTYRGKGYAKEAIALVLRFYFYELGFNKVETRVYGFNENSLKLHEKLGFVEEGRLRDNHFSNGSHHDTVCYGMLRSEFESVYGKYQF